jgi:hypothetical protein
MNFDYIGIGSRTIFPSSSPSPSASVLPLEEHHHQHHHHHGISLRKRSSMLLMLSRALMEVSSQNRTSAYLDWGDDEDFVSQYMMQINQDIPGSFQLANDTMSGQFSASDAGVHLDAFAVSGKLTLASHSDRDAFLKICTEGKTLFTSLHHPGTYMTHDTLCIYITCIVMLYYYIQPLLSHCCRANE